MKPSRVLFLALLCLPVVSGCSNSVKQTLGINKKAPDEFKVLARPPLSVPPEFSLRPPSDGGEDEAVISPRDEARSAVFGAATAPAAAPENRIVLTPGKAETAVQPVTTGTLGKSNAEATFLRNAGADQADSAIREEMRREEAARIAEEKSTLESLTTLPEKKDPVVDAGGEAQRIQQNKAEGKPVTEGETPESRPTDRGILGGIFGF